MPYHRSEEHTSELQSHDNLVCRLLLEKKKTITASTSPCPPHSPQPLTSRSRTTRRQKKSNRTVRTTTCVSFSFVSFFMFFFLNITAPPKFSPFSFPTLFRF